MANISNFGSGNRNDYRVFTYDSGNRIVQVDVYKNEADYLSSTMTNTNKIQRINQTFDDQCRLTKIVTITGRDLDSTGGAEIVRRTTTTEMTYGGSKVLTKETTSA